MKKMMRLAAIALLITILPSFKFTDGPKKAAPGTYQFVIRDTKKEFVYTDELLIIIEEKRKDHEEISVPLNKQVDVIIPSREQIKAPDFKPMAEFFYIN